MKNKVILSLLLLSFILSGCTGQQSDTGELLDNVANLYSSLATEENESEDDEVVVEAPITDGANVDSFTTLARDEIESYVEKLDIPDFTDSAYIEINTNIPFFKEEDLVSDSYEYYSDLDNLGRCGVAEACVGQDIMPTEERGEIGSVKPSGWQTIKYDIVSGKYLYNRCHLLGYQLTAENANKKNLITGTRYLNIDGMLGFENEVADYIKSTGNHVMYRVTPIFEGDNLVASGVVMEGRSIEDNKISFCVYCYNAQPGIEINYSDGTSHEVGFDESKEFTNPENQAYYIINESTKKYHTEECRYANSENVKRVHKSKKQLENDGYEACKICNP